MRATASAMAGTSSGSKSSAASPAMSGRQVALELATGTPAWKASTTGMPKPSKRLGKTTIRASW
jgi:hypothetical protein